MYFGKKEFLTPEQIRINELKEELRNCEVMLKRAEQMFDMTTDEYLIEARIYEIKSLIKHHDYLICTLKQLMRKETINV